MNKIIKNRILADIDDLIDRVSQLKDLNISIREIIMEHLENSATIIRVNYK